MEIVLGGQILLAALMVLALVQVVIAYTTRNTPLFTLGTICNIAAIAYVIKQILTG